MRLFILSFTDRGYVLANRIRELVCASGIVSDCIVNCMGASHKGKLGYTEESLTEWSGRRFLEHDGILFIGATGIAVRSIAPHLTDKLHDSPVLTMDELAQYVIPLLSGHVGGANELAQKLSVLIGAIPVITTATDLNHCFAVDLFARRNHLQILNREGIAYVSAKSLRGETIKILVDPNRVHTKPSNPQIELIWDTEEKPDVVISTDWNEKNSASCLYLKPREYVIGIGCKKDKPFEELNSFVEEQLLHVNVLPQDIYGICSHILKQNEQGILKLCTTYGVPFMTYNTEELEKVEGEFSESSFVKSTTGVDCVCERAAMVVSEGGELIVPKVAQNGMTFALARRKWEIDFEES